MKIGARGVEYAFETFSTNCPGALPQLAGAFRQGARTETTIAQNYLDPFWCFGFSMNPVASRVGPMPAPIAHRDFWMLALAVDGNTIGDIQAACFGHGGTVRVGDTITGGLSSDDGWTWDLAIRARACTPVVTIDGSYLDKPITDYTPTSPEQIDSYLYRNVFQTVDVYPY